MTMLFKADAQGFDPDADSALRKAYGTSEWCILPILFGLWMLPARVDRANVAFVKLQMSPDPGFSETAYGFGAGLLFLGYVLLGTPSAIVQRRAGAQALAAALLITGIPLAHRHLIAQVPRSERA